MRLWTLHPRYFDRQGLVTLWREALLARAVLRGRTRGYTRHPQLERFRAHPAPRRAYLAVVHAEAATDAAIRGEAARRDAVSAGGGPVPDTAPPSARAARRRR